MKRGKNGRWNKKERESVVFSLRNSTVCLDVMEGLLISLKNCHRVAYHFVLDQYEGLLKSCHLLDQLFRFDTSMITVFLAGITEIGQALRMVQVKLERMVS